MRRSLLLLSLFLIVPITGHAQLPPNQECYALGEVARSISSARASGIAKEQMIEGIQVMVSQTRALWSQQFFTEAYELIDEVYAYGALDPIVYGAYRSELCRIVRSGGQVDVPFADAYLDLLMCARSESEARSRECGIGVAASYAGDDAGVGDVDDR